MKNNHKKSLLSKTVAVGIAVSMMPSVAVHADDTTEDTQQDGQIIQATVNEDGQLGQKLSGNVSANNNAETNVQTPAQEQPAQPENQTGGTHALLISL